MSNKLLYLKGDTVKILHCDSAPQQEYLGTLGTVSHIDANSRKAVVRFPNSLTPTHRKIGLKFPFSSLKLMKLSPIRWMKIHKSSLPHLKEMALIAEACGGIPSVSQFCKDVGIFYSTLHMHYRDFIYTLEPLTHSERSLRKLEDMIDQGKVRSLSQAAKDVGVTMPFIQSRPKLHRRLKEAKNKRKCA